jgi:glucosamine kinase
MSAELFLGIDGGGTRCRARLRDGAGRLLAEAEGEMANVFVDVDAALQAILDVSRAVIGTAGLDSGHLARVHAGFGLAGVVDGRMTARLHAAGLPFASLRVDNDAYAACLGAHGGRDGAIVIAGTGSCGLALIDGDRHTVGGWGFALGDDGSGAAVGRSVLRRALLGHEAILPASPLTERVMMSFGNDPVRLLDWSRTAQSRDYAGFAPLVFEYAAGGDSVGREIADKAGTDIGLLIEALRARGARLVALVGGLSKVIEPYLPAVVIPCLVAPEGDAMEGAILMARRGCA